MALPVNSACWYLSTLRVVSPARRKLAGAWYLSLRQGSEAIASLTLYCLRHFTQKTRKQSTVRRETMYESVYGVTAWLMPASALTLPYGNKAVTSSQPVKLSSIRFERFLSIWSMAVSSADITHSPSRHTDGF